MLCQYGTNKIEKFRSPEDEEYVKETDTRDEPLQDSQPTQIGKRSKFHMHEAPDEEAESTNSRHLCQNDQTAPRSAADAENITHR